MTDKQTIKFTTYDLSGGILDEKIEKLPSIQKQIPNFDQMIKLGLFFRLGERMFLAFKNSNLID
jgi:hypothetical protein